MAETPTLAKVLTMGMWAPAYAFIAWAAWYRFRRTPAGRVLTLAFAIQAVHATLATADLFGLLGGHTQNLNAGPVHYIVFWSASLLVMVIQVVGFALIPLSLERLRSRTEAGQRGA